MINRIAMQIGDYLIQNPIVFISLVAAIGASIGRIRIRNFSLGISGLLFASIIAGLIIGNAGSINDASNKLLENCRVIATLGTSLFISVIGVSNGSFLCRNFSECRKSFAAGASTMAFTLVLLISAILLRLGNPSTLCGVFCGALTSTPGLSTITSNDISPEAVIGYGSSYFIGLLSIIIFVQLADRNKEKTVVPIYHHNQAGKEGKLITSLFCTILPILIGSIIGSLRTLYLGLSLGTTCGILIASIFTGAVIGRTTCVLSDSFLNTVRVLGLTLFFVGNGIRAGMDMQSSFELATILLAAVFSVLTITVGYFLSILITKNKHDAISVVCGIMTSSPAIAIHQNSQGSNENNSKSTIQFSSAYAGAVITIVLGLRLVQYMMSLQLLN